MCCTTPRPPPRSYTLSLHDALPICQGPQQHRLAVVAARAAAQPASLRPGGLRRAVRAEPDDLDLGRSEEHTSELQSHVNLVCSLLLEKKNTRRAITDSSRGRACARD